MLRNLAAIGLAAFALLDGAAAYAGGNREGWYSIAPNSRYSCKRNVALDNGSPHVIGAFIAHAPGGRAGDPYRVDVRWCEGLCNRARGCVAFYFEHRVNPVTGAETNRCFLLASEYAGTHDFTQGNVFEYGAVCYLPKRATPTEDALEGAVRRYSQDHLRPPSAPGSGAPSQRYR